MEDIFNPSKIEEDEIFNYQVKMELSIFKAKPSYEGLSSTRYERKK